MALRDHSPKWVANSNNWMFAQIRKVRGDTHISPTPSPTTKHKNKERVGVER